eukprot:gb/GEZN01004911.1/.p1 GENE.gb/GEZN01004911.1/~~gb/GEZN01004911.1/.p1  ORF type:complete len:588 (-),score=79.48 gb/GEZN01004911.1/:82-1845(-)
MLLRICRERRISYVPLHWYKISRLFSSTASDNMAFRTGLKLPSWLTTKLPKLSPPLLGPPSPIQRLAIPHIRTAWPTQPIKDVLVQDVTGSGKTLAYLLPILADIDNFDRKLQAVIVVPSKQLAHQIKNLADALCKGGGKARKENPVVISQMSSQGMDPYTRSRLTEIDEEERCPHVLIGTPGVIAEYLVDPDFAPKLRLRHLVLDEIDYLLNLPAHLGAVKTILATRQNFPGKQVANPPAATKKQLAIEGATTEEPRPVLREDVDCITEEVEAEEAVESEKPVEEVEAEETEEEWEKPIVTKVVGVSATITEAVHNWAKLNLTPDYVFVTPNKALISASQQKFRNDRAAIPRRIQHFYLKCEKRLETLPILLEHFRKDWLRIHKLTAVDRRVPHPKIIVFFDRWDKPLIAQLQYVLKKRDWKVGVVSEFSSRHEARQAMHEDVQVMLTTDLFSRGLDFASLSHVVNYHVPKRTNAYIHRAGRVGRLGGAQANNAKVVSMLGHSGQEEFIERFARNLALDIKRVKVDYETGHVSFPPARIEGGYISSRKLLRDSDKQHRKQAAQLRRSAQITRQPSLDIRHSDASVV